MKHADEVILYSPGKKEALALDSTVMWDWIKNVARVSMTGYTIMIPSEQRTMNVHEFMEEYAPAEGNT